MKFRVITLLIIEYDTQRQSYKSIDGFPLGNSNNLPLLLHINTVTGLSN